jgi:GntR family transcriptional regulator
MVNFANTPLYLQICDVLARRIASGEWPARAAIPAEVELARELGVSAGTLRKALELLENDGLVTRRRGRGTFVADHSRIASRRYDGFRGPGGEAAEGEVSVVAVGQNRASGIERTRLRLGGQDPVWRLRRVCSHGSSRFLVEDLSLPVAVFPGLDGKMDLCARSIIVIAHAYGLLLGRGIERIALSTASGPAAVALGVAQGVPAMVLDRVVESRDGLPLEWRVAECVATAMHYEVERG